MKIDILSDLHFDNYFYNKYSKDDVINFYSQIIDFNNCGDVLVIAGDLGHNNHQNIKILKILKEFYKNIVCVLGNHDYYLMGKENKSLFKNSFERVSNMRELINKEDNIYCLNGDIIEIDSVKFGGCDSWYNDGFLRVNYPKADFPLKSNNAMWQNCTPDSKFVFGIENFDDIFEIEKPKIEKVYKECDVMITHINPSAKKEYLNAKYQNNQSSTFFCFDGEKYLQNGSMKFWIFGHNHDVIEYKEHNVKCICNPLGYYNESGNGQWIKIKQIEV
ncbi:metallophosphoesterase [Aliarcobacter butzleri]|uniref:metallophosphoesterase n=1 Tax=Aliarcobacter butzleri TaxID=28197 RepID=UPI002B24774E|nr:metallophosphoesterase [Aliarcobacter butzleri]